MRRRSSSVFPTVEPCAIPPSLSAVTGLSSIRFEVSAALRMSESPIVRTFSACAANSGLPLWAEPRACRNESTLASSSGIASAATGGAIFGACVSCTCSGASGAVRVMTGSGGARGAGSAAAPPASGVPVVMARSLARPT